MNGPHASGVLFRRGGKTGADLVFLWLLSCILVFVVIFGFLCFFFLLFHHQPTMKVSEKALYLTPPVYWSVEAKLALTW